MKSSQNIARHLLAVSSIPYSFTYCNKVRIATAVNKLGFHQSDQSKARIG